MKKLLKTIYFKLLCGNSFVRKGVHFGSGSYIREHAQISGGENIFLGSHTRIGPYSRLQCFMSISGEKFDPHMKIGNNVMIGRNVTISCCNEVIIGDNCLITGYCFFCDSNHGMDAFSEKRYEAQTMDRKTVKLGQNVFVGEKAIILPGVTIGDNAIIGAGSVVTKSIPANSMAVGNPAKVIKVFDLKRKSWIKVTNG